MTMARNPSKASIKAAADRAEARSKGEEIDPPTGVLNPPETAPTVGRPTEYKAEFCDIAANACARGATIAELAEILGVARFTVYRWMALHQEFGDAIRISKTVADERVGFSLYERAVGYSHNAVKIFVPKGSDLPLVVPYVEHVAPDVTAQKFWLTNRRPEEWKERSSKEISGPGGSAIKIENTGDIDQARRVAFALGRALERQRMKVIDAD